MQDRWPVAARDGGESLLELLVAVVIMGIAVVAIVAGIGTGVLMSDVHRKEATAGAVLRDYAEAVAGGGYASCASTSAYSSPAGFTVPAGYAATVTGVRYWDDSAKVFSATCGSPDGGVQRVSLRVASGDGRAAETLDLIIRKPCSASPACS